MASLESKLEKIEASVAKIVQGYKKLQTENQTLRIDLERLETTNKEQKIELNKLVERNNFIKLAKSIKSEDDTSKVFRKELDDYISNINNCLAMLNDEN